MEAPANAPVTGTASSLTCHICDLNFNTAEEKRQHAKSEWHVYRIRCRVAEPGTVIPPPDTEATSSTLDSTRKSRSRSPKIDEGSYEESEESEEEGSESESSSDHETFDLVDNQCLFCNHTSQDLDQNLSHMQQTHSFVVPFQSSLAVDLQTIILYLYMVVFSYRECICCGKRRRTVEAVQQHMTSMGHCRFDVTDEMSDFYSMESLAQQTTPDITNPDDQTLRLPSGKLLAHRSHVDNTPRNRLRDKIQASQPSLDAPQKSTSGSQAITRKDRQERALTAQFAQLSRSDQMTLAHLPESQQRSLLLAHKKEVDRVKREERKARRKLDNVGNKTAVHTNYYKQEVPIYSGG